MKQLAIPCYYEIGTGKKHVHRPPEYTRKSYIFFPSELECDVYRELRKYFPDRCISRQIKLLIKPATNDYPALHWKCDFKVVKPDNGDYMLIEAKGMITREFIRNVQYLNLFMPMDYERLLFVSRKPMDIDQNHVSVSISDMIKVLKQQGFIVPPKSTWTLRPILSTGIEQYKD